jgi:hypothetical protein
LWRWRAAVEEDGGDPLRRKMEEGHAAARLTQSVGSLGPPLASRRFARMCMDVQFHPI